MSAVRLYREHAIPCLTHLAMRSERLNGLRARIAGMAFGRTVEIGIGSGLNMPFYTRRVEELTGIDTSIKLLARARERARWLSFKTTLYSTSAEQLPFESHIFDTAIVTWSLCSIKDPQKALAELARTLKPGGQLLFIEHGLNETSSRVARWQVRLSPFWQAFSGGCHLNRRPTRLILDAGFTLNTLETGPLIAAPALINWQACGSATAPY